MNHDTPQVNFLLPKLRQIIHMDYKVPYSVFHLGFDNPPLKNDHFLVRLENLERSTDISMYKLHGGANPNNYDFGVEVDDESIFREEKPFCIRRKDSSRIKFAESGSFPINVGDKLVAKILQGPRYEKRLIGTDATLSGVVQRITEPSDLMMHMMEFKLPLPLTGNTTEQIYKDLFAAAKVEVE